MSDHVDTGEDPFLTMLSDNNELEEEKQDLSSTNLNEIKSVKLEDLSDHEKSHSTLDNDDHMLEKEEKDSSNAESSLSQGTKSSLQEKLYSKFKRNSPSENEFASMLKEEQPKKEENHEEDVQETASSINKEDTSIEDKNDDENQFPSKQDKTKNLFDEFYSMLDESFDHSKSNQEEIEALSDHVDTGEDPFLTMLSDSNELEEEKQDLSSTNLNEIKSVKLEDLSDHEKSHSTLDNDDHMLEKEEKDSSNAESSLSQGTKSSLQEKLYSKFKRNSPSENEFASMLKEEQPKKEENHEEDVQETASSINKEDTSIEDKNDDENQFPSKQDKTKNLFDEFYSMLDESFDHSNSNQEELEALSDHVDTGEDPFLTMLSDSNELEEEKQDLSSTNLNETKSVKIEDLSDHEKSHSTLENEESLLEKEEKDSSNAESSLSQGTKSSLQEKLYSKFKKNSPSENEFALMLKEDQPKKEENHEEDAQETASNINKEDSSLLDKHAPILEVDSIEKETESNTMKKISLMLKEEQPKKEANHEEDAQETGIKYQ